MVIHLVAGDPWAVKAARKIEIPFASASAKVGDPTLTVRVNDDEVDCVTLRAPHSWWALAGNPLIPRALEPGDVLTITADGDCDLRLDLLEDGNTPKTTSLDAMIASAKVVAPKPIL